MKLKKGFYLCIGYISLAIGFVAAVIPLLPSFPFLLLAGISFGRSSEKIHTWFVNTKLYQNNLESYLKKKGMTKKAKFNLITTVTLSMSIGFYMMRKMPIGQIILAIVWVCHILYFLFGVPNITPEENERIISLNTNEGA